MRNLSLVAATLAAASAGPAMAQEASPGTETAFLFNTLFTVFCGVLVMFMAAGFTMLEAGFVRARNVSMQLAKNVGAFIAAGLGFLALGGALQNPNGAWLVDGLLSATPPGGNGIGDYGETQDGAAVSGGAIFFLQMMFCATTISIVSGAMAERVRLVPFMLFALIMTAVIYPIQASWSWGGGVLDRLGFVDQAGSVVVHTVGGWAALAGVVIIGPRVARFQNGLIQPMPGSNLPLSTLGVFMLWFGWFGFNGSAALNADPVQGALDIGRILVNTNAAGAGGALAAMILTRALFRKVDLTLVVNGGLAGLVAITAEPLAPSPFAALLVGAVGGAIVVLAVPALDKLRIDDVVGAIPVHLGAGIWGGVAAGFTAPEGSVLAQLAGIGLIGLFVFGASILVWFALQAAIGLRFPMEFEQEGLDINELGMEAYPDFVTYEDG